MFYDRYVMLCSRKGVSPSRAAIDAGLNKSSVTKWKNDPDARPTGAVIEKLTRYFGVSVAELLGEGDVRPVTDEDIKFALFGGSEDVTPAMFEEVKAFAAFIRDREAAKRKE